jgi:hypothetical protein
VRIPKGATCGVSDSIDPSTPNFAAAYAVQNNWPAIPAVEEIVSSRPDRPVATTEWPASKTALAMSTPKPRPAPVISHTFLPVTAYSSFGSRSVDPDDRSL